MATYTELFTLSRDDDGQLLRNRVAVAIAVKAHSLLGATPTAGQIAWAGEALENPGGKVSQLLHYVLAANKGATLATINGASDNTVQTAVDTAVDAMVS